MVGWSFCADMADGGVTACGWDWVFDCNEKTNETDKRYAQDRLHLQHREGMLHIILVANPSIRQNYSEQVDCDDKTRTRHPMPVTENVPDETRMESG